MIKSPAPQLNDLRLAVINGRVDLVDELLRQGADPGLIDDYGVTLLHEACCNDKDQVALVDRLLQAGVAVNAATPNGITPLHWAAMRGNNGVCSRLLAAGASVHIKFNLDSPLDWAQSSGFSSTCALLLRHGSVIGQDRAWPLAELCARRFDAELAEQLLSRQLLAHLQEASRIEAATQLRGWLAALAARMAAATALHDAPHRGAPGA